MADIRDTAEFIGTDSNAGYDHRSLYRAPDGRFFVWDADSPGEPDYLWLNSRGAAAEWVYGGMLDRDGNGYTWDQVATILDGDDPGLGQRILD